MSEGANVEVVYLGKECVFHRRLQVAAGSTVLQAVSASGLESEAEPGCVNLAKIGIFSRPVTPDKLVSDGDRIEVYRPLELDPKDARRRRAAPAG